VAGARRGDERDLGRSRKRFPLSQERIVFAIAALLFLGFSIFVRGFLNADNVLSLIQNVSILGVLGIGMAQAIIGRGIDLSIVATMAMTVAWSLDLMQRGTTAAPALAAGLALAVVIGLLNGFLIAYVEIPSIFATLAMATVIYGFGQNFLVPTDITYLSPTANCSRRSRWQRRGRAEPGDRLRTALPDRSVAHRVDEAAHLVVAQEQKAIRQ